MQNKNINLYDIMWLTNFALIPEFFDFFFQNKRFFFFILCTSNTENYIAMTKPFYITTPVT